MLYATGKWIITITIILTTYRCFTYIVLGLSLCLLHTCKSVLNSVILSFFGHTSLFITDSCKVEFKDPNVLHEFTLTITPGKKVNLFPSFSVQTYCTVFINFYFLNWKEKATGRMGFLSFMSLYQRIIT